MKMKIGVIEFREETEKNGMADCCQSPCHFVFHNNLRYLEEESMEKFCTLFKDYSDTNVI
jgi:hypothetical protein